MAENRCRCTQQARETHCADTLRRRTCNVAEEREYMVDDGEGHARCGTTPSGNHDLLFLCFCTLHWYQEFRELALRRRHFISKISKAVSFFFIENQREWHKKSECMTPDSALQARHLIGTETLLPSITMAQHDTA